MTSLIWIALGLFAVGAIMWCVGHFRHDTSSITSGSGKSAILGGFLGPLYWLICMGCYLAIVLAHLGLFNSTAVIGEVKTWVASIDPVLRVFVYAVGGCVFLCLLPGIFVIALCSLGLGLALIAFSYYQVLLKWVASISTGGQILAILLGIIPPLLVVWWLMQRFGTQLKVLLFWLAMPIYGILFEWWLTPLLTRRKEKRLMDDVENKRAKYEGSLETLQTQFPEVRGVSLSNGYDTWYERIVQRITDRDRQKTFAEKIKLLGLTKQFFIEYRAALDAHDEFTRAPATYKAKDETAEIEALRREEEKLVLEKKITELKKEPVIPPVPPPRPVDRRSPGERMFDALSALDREEAEQLAKCGGNPRREEEIKRYYEHRRMNISESV